MNDDQRDLTVEHRAAVAALNGRGDNPLRCLSTIELRTLPPVTWLIQDTLVAHGFAVLYGPSGGGKSFLALDWALTVATGTSWLGRAAVGGWVLYVSAEGAAGLAKRIDAWRDDREQPEPERIRFVIDAPDLLDATNLAHLIEHVRQLPEPPALIVIDTMARTLGGDENSARDVSHYVRSIYALRAAAADATALVLHHTGKKGDEERGSSVLRASTDQTLALTSNGHGIRLEHARLKDFHDASVLDLHLATAGDSAVIAVGSSRAELSVHEWRLLALLSDVDGSDQPSVTRLIDHVGAAPLRKGTGGGQAPARPVPRPAPLLRDAGGEGLGPAAGPGLHGARPHFHHDALRPPHSCGRRCGRPLCGLLSRPWWYRGGTEPGHFRRN